VYAIVDIETTGGSASKSRITEIAIFVHDGKKVVQQYQTLVNSCREVPYHISRLTGIHNEMLVDAPLFHEIIEDIEKHTSGCVFVAHNVNFDYGFIREEYKRAGKSFQRKKLCTVRLSRKIFPQLPSYSLGRLCAQLNINNKERHRAAGDAEATVELFEKLLANDKEDFINASLNQRSLEALLPPNLPKNEFLALPEKLGIYYMMDRNKKIIYIGKANNIRKRVHSHFSGNTNTRSKYYFVKNIHHVDYKVCGNEFIALLTEASEIKKHWPIHNRSLKRFSLNYALYSYEDRNGYFRFSMGRCGKHDQPLLSFKSAAELRTFVEKLCLEYELCPKLCDLQKPGNNACFPMEEHECKGACTLIESPTDYNLRYQEAFGEIKGSSGTYVIRCEGNTEECNSIVLMQKGRYKGYGQLSKELEIKDLKSIKEHIDTGYDDQDIQNLVSSYLRSAPAENVIWLND